MKGCVQMGNKQTRYSAEFKEMIIKLYKNGKTPTEIMNEYGLSRAALYKWINASKEITVDDEKITALEIRKLKAQIKELEEENDILKKVMTIFAKK